MISSNTGQLTVDLPETVPMNEGRTSECGLAYLEGKDMSRLWPVSQDVSPRLWYDLQTGSIT